MKDIKISDVNKCLPNMAIIRYIMIFNRDCLKNKNVIFLFVWYEVLKTYKQFKSNEIQVSVSYIM